jgi:hypothetical protein
MGDIQSGHNNHMSELIGCSITSCRATLLPLFVSNPQLGFHAQHKEISAVEEPVARQLGFWQLFAAVAADIAIPDT